MKKFLAWIASKRWRSSLSHALLSIPIFFIVYGIAFLFGLDSASFIAAAFIVGWWWSREKTQYEYKHKTGRTITVWHKGWLPFEWDGYSILDLALPCVIIMPVAMYLRS